MTIKEKLEYLRKEAERLEKAISKYMEIDLNDAADVASHELKVINAKIKEFEKLEEE